MLRTCSLYQWTENNWNATWGREFEAKYLVESPGPREKNARSSGENKQKANQKMLKTGWNTSKNLI